MHFIYLSTYNAPRISFFHNFKPGEILLRKWNREDEDLDENIPEDSEVFYYALCIIFMQENFIQDWIAESKSS